jgi:hypothetical protein
MHSTMELGFSALNARNSKTLRSGLCALRGEALLFARDGHQRILAHADSVRGFFDHHMVIDV